MSILFLSKLARKTEEELLGKDYLAPGIPKPERSELPVIKKPQTWEFSAHPHLAERAGPHIDIRLGDPSTGIAHSFVLPKRAELPKPGEMARVIPTFDHDIEYMDYTGRISSEYGRGVVVKGRREKADVYHSAPGKDQGTKLRFNLYEGANPEEFSIRSDGNGNWFLHNKTLTRERRPDLPADKPQLKEIDIDSVDAGNEQQAMMPKLDGAHSLIDLQAGRAPRVFSYRVGKISKTGLIEHTHKLPGLLTYKVPKELDGTILRAETVGIDQSGKVLPAQRIAGLLNSKVWESRKQQEKSGVILKSFPFNVVKFKGKNVEDAPFDEKLKMIEQVRKAIPDLGEIPVMVDPKDKIYLLNAIKSKEYPLTQEGVVLVDESNRRTFKAKVLPDYDVFVRKVVPAVSGKTGEPLDRAGAVAYSWTPKGPIIGQVAGFKHEEARDMLQHPDRYVGRVAKVKATKQFTDSGALFQPRFKEWHLDKGDIEKAAALSSEVAANIIRRLYTKTPVEAMSLRPRGLIQTARDLMREGSGDFVPLAQRLENYKFWKSTGVLPTIRKSRSGTISVASPSTVNRPALYQLENAPISLVSHGTVEGLTSALQQPRTLLDRRYLIPGDTISYSHGIYAYPLEYATRGVGYASKGSGTPGRLNVDIPIKHVIQGTGERPEVLMIPSHVRNITKSEIAPIKKTAMIDAFFDEIEKIGAVPRTLLAEMASGGVGGALGSAAASERKERARQTLIGAISAALSVPIVTAIRDAILKGKIKVRLRS